MISHPDLLHDGAELLVLQPADLLQPLLLELVRLQDLDEGDGGAQDAALVVLDVLGQLVVAAIFKMIRI